MIHTLHTHSSYTNSLAFTQPLTDSMIDVDDALELLTEDNEFRVPLLRSNSHMFTHSRPSGGRDSAIGGQGRERERLTLRGIPAGTPRREGTQRVVESYRKKERKENVRD